MAESGELLKREGVVTPALSALNRQPTFLVKEGPANTIKVDANCPTATANNAQHNLIIPSYDHVIQRNGVFWEGNPLVSFNVTLQAAPDRPGVSGGDVIFPTDVAFGFNLLRPQQGSELGSTTTKVSMHDYFDFGIASHPLHRLLTNVTVQMGGSIPTTFDKDTLDSLLPLIDGQRGYKPYRHQRSVFAVAADARGTSLDAFAAHDVATLGRDEAMEPNGCFNSDLEWCNAAGDVLGVGGFYNFTSNGVNLRVQMVRVNNSARDLSGIGFTNNIAVWPVLIAQSSANRTLTKGQTIQVPLYLRIRSREPLLFPPFTQLDTEGPGFHGVQQIQLQFGFRDIASARVFLPRRLNSGVYAMEQWPDGAEANPDLASMVTYLEVAGPDAISDATWGTSNVWQECRISTICLQPQPDNLPPQVCTFGTYKLYPNVTPYSGALAAGESVTVPSASTALAQVPSFIIVSAPVKSYEAGLVEHVNLLLQDLNINFNGMSSIFASYTLRELYELTRKTCPDISWAQFRGVLWSHGMPCASNGNYFVIRGEDLWLAPGVCPGQPGSLQFSITAKVFNQLNVPASFSLYTLAVVPKFFSISRGSMVEVPASEMAMPADVFEMKADRANRFTAADLMIGGAPTAGGHVTGGGWMDRMLGIASKAKSAFNTAKSFADTALPIVRSATSTLADGKFGSTIGNLAQQAKAIGLGPPPGSKRSRFQ